MVIVYLLAMGLGKLWIRFMNFIVWQLPYNSFIRCGHYVNLDLTHPPRTLLKSISAFFSS